MTYIGQADSALVQLRDILSAYAQLDDQLAELTSQKDELRVRISELVEAVGPQRLPGFGRVEITSAARVASYDTKALDALCAELEAAGDPLATRLMAARRESMRVGSLKITRER